MSWATCSKTVSARRTTRFSSPTLPGAKNAGRTFPKQTLRGDCSRGSCPAEYFPGLPPVASGRDHAPAPRRRGQGASSGAPGTRAVRSRASRPAAQRAATARGTPPASAAFLYPSPTAAARFQRPAKTCTDRGHGHSGPGCLARLLADAAQKNAAPPPRWSGPIRPSASDLGRATADAAHRDFLRRLLGDMALPKGSHAFWPLNRYPYGDGESNRRSTPGCF